MSEQLGLSSTNKDPQAWSQKEEVWDATMKTIVSRYSQASFTNINSIDIASVHEGNPELHQSMVNEIFTVNFSSALESLQFVSCLIPQHIKK